MLKEQARNKIDQRPARGKDRIFLEVDPTALPAVRPVRWHVDAERGKPLPRSPKSMRFLCRHVTHGHRSKLPLLFSKILSAAAIKGYAEAGMIVLMRNHAHTGLVPKIG